MGWDLESACWLLSILSPVLPILSMGCASNPHATADSDCAAPEPLGRSEGMETQRLSGRLAVNLALLGHTRVLVRASAIPSATLPRGGKEHTALVAADATFEVEIPDPSEATLLELESDILRLPSGKEVPVGQDDIVLRPEVMAVVICRLEPSALARELGVDPGQAHLLCGPVGKFPVTEFGPSSLWQAGEQVSNGTFRFSLLPSQQEMLLQAESGDSIGLLHIPPLRPGERRQVRLALEERGVIQGRVIDHQGSSVPNAQLRARHLLPGSPIVDAMLARSDELGEFVLGRLAPGPWSVEVSAPDLDRALLTVEVREGCNLSLPPIVLGVPAEVLGRVLFPDGRACPSALVHAVDHSPEHPYRYGDGDRGPKALSGPDGRFRLIVPTGWLTLVADRHEYARSVATSLSLQSGETREGLVLSLRDGAPIRGRVADDRGRGVRAQLTLLYEDGSVSNLSSDADGYFSATIVPPGNAKLTASVSREVVGEVYLEIGPDGTEGIELLVSTEGRK